MSVFVSHRSSDDVKARQIRDFLVHQGIRCYLDDLDEGLRTADDIAAAVQQRLNECSRLLAVVSAATAGSWWVPFEIGLGTAKDTRIASFRLIWIDLPQYLTKWPILSSDSDLLQYARLYNADGRVLLEKGLQSESRSSRLQSAADFHKALKHALGQ
jgi:hypothetical protein